ncbi:MAG: GNAT family N-acetyltransferase [Gemmobacter sp.]
MSVPDANALLAVLEATWPAARRIDAGPFVLREGRDAGSRVSSATAQGPATAADVAEAAEAMRALGQEALFRIGPGDGALDELLAGAGFERRDPTLILAAPIGAIAGEAPPVTAFAHWPPLAVLGDIWTAEGIGAARQAVMARVAGPHAAILGRTGDRPAGGAFVGVAGEGAMVHAVAVRAPFRRQGLARALMLSAARWAEAQGARWLAVAVTEANAPARALYAGLGMAEAARYHYRAAPGR